MKYMLNWLKKHFIPHEGNGNRPHILSRENTKQIIGVILFFELILFIFPALNFAGFINTLNLSAVLPGVLTHLSNEKRVGVALHELVESPVLNASAKLKAEDMAAKSYFAHTSPEGKTPWHWLEVVGYKYTHAGENLAVNFVDSQDVVVAWMNSPSHRANIVQGAYTEVGTGIATGRYKGRDTIFVAQVYGRPTAAYKAAVINQSASSTTQINNNIQNPNVLGESVINTVPEETVKGFLQEAAASPRHSTDAVLYSVLGIITLALLFNIFIKIREQHMDLIVNGAAVVVIILGLHLSNVYISEVQSQETTFVAYDSQQELE